MIINYLETGNDRKGLHCGGETLEKISMFKYLECVITNDGRLNENVSNEVGSPHKSLLCTIQMCFYKNWNQSKNEIQ